LIETQIVSVVWARSTNRAVVTQPTLY